MDLSIITITNHKGEEIYKFKDKETKEIKKEDEFIVIYVGGRLAMEIPKNSLSYIRYYEVQNTTNKSGENIQSAVIGLL